jgi:hypothetical protein
MRVRVKLFVEVYDSPIGTVRLDLGESVTSSEQLVDLRHLLNAKREYGRTFG